jgi:Calcium binding
MTKKRQEKVTQGKPEQSLSKERLDELVDEATVDAHDESEQASGFYTMLENDLRLPFETEVLGMTVMVESIDIAEDDRLVAVCGSGKHRQRISLADLPLPPTLPEGAQWILAYRYWRTGAR